jgi:flagellar secretion chaperone FliS
MNWKSAYVESRIISASPLELISILYEHAILEVQQARESLARGEVAARSRSISKAIAIIGELQRSLDHDAGGEIAANLERLYQYMRARLTAGNLHKSDSPLAEVASLLESLGEAWRTIAVSNGDVVSDPGLSLPTGYTPRENPSAVMAGWSV